MFKLQSDLQEMLWHRQLKSRWLGRRPSDPRWIGFVEGRPVKVGVDRLSAMMAMVDTPFVGTVGLRVFRALSRSAADGRAVEVFVFPAGTSYVVNLLRVVDKNGRGEFQSLLRPQGKKQFRFADLGAAMRLAMRIVSARSEAAFERVLRRAERDINTK